MSVPGEDALNWIRQEIAEYEPQLPPRPPYAHPLIESLRFLLRLAEDNDHQIEQLQARIQELETEQNERWRPLTDLIEAQKARIQELEAQLAEKESLDDFRAFNEMEARRMDGEGT